MAQHQVFLRKGKEKLPFNRHPWVFSGAVERIVGSPMAGEVVQVRTADGRFVAWAHYNPTSKIILRLLEWDESMEVNDLWYAAKIQLAVELRRQLIAADTTAYRLIFSEADFLPGLIVDRLGQYLVVQCLTSGFEGIKSRITALLLEHVPGIRGVYEKSDGDGRKMEGLPNRMGWLGGEGLEEDIEVLENGCTFRVNLHDQKTGFYADQRDNRALVSGLAKGRHVLDMFCYSGGFSAYAAQAGAAGVTLCDSSVNAITLATQNLALNNPTSIPVECHQADAFQFLRKLQAEQRTFELVVLDPPKLVPNMHALDRGLRAYKDLNLQAMKVVSAGGFLATFSCSGAVSAEQFQQMVAFAAKDAGREVQIIRLLFQAPDHPVRASVPETAYLKGLLLRVV